MMSLASHANDFIEVEELDEDIILNLLRKRYEINSIYTSIGDIIVAVNPFENLDIYDAKTKAKYDIAAISSQLLPHIYGISLSMYKSLLQTGEHQSCIVSGESGSGKTETVKHMIDHVLHICKSNEIDDLQEKIIQINPLLEAFGNARTSMNTNSSRFGKYLQLYFTSNGKVLGASITEYLLEKSRIVHQNKNEGCYHIFNWMLAGLPEEQLDSLLINRSQRWSYLNNDEHIQSSEKQLSTWQRKCKEITASMNAIGFSMDDVYNVFTMLAAILNIGEIRFNLEDCNEKAYVSNTEILDRVSVLLGVDSDDFERALTTNVTKTNDLTIQSYKNIDQAKDCREAISKALYGRLFGWLVNRINLLLFPMETAGRQSGHTSLGFLDIFGFEDFQQNSFEQLCINVANEQLHFYFVQHVFAWEQLEYVQEEIDADSVKYKDNKGLINLLLEKPLGIFALLDEESRFPQADDNTLVSKFNAHCSKNHHYIIINASEPSFGINHYAGKVVYDADGFLEKNRDTLSPILMDCMRTSTDPLVSSLFNSLISRTGSLITRSSSLGIDVIQNNFILEADIRQRKRLDSSSRTQTGQRRHSASSSKHRSAFTRRRIKAPLTVGSHFRNSLVDLMERILVTQPHFVRCIKPNPNQLPKTFVDDFVQRQLKYCGILETIIIRKRGFPVRLSFKSFIDRFKFVAFPMTKQVEATKENCIEILQKGTQSRNFKIGRSKVFLKQHQITDLISSLEKVIRDLITVQKVIRGKLARIKFGDLLSKQHMEERSVGNFLVSISSRNSKILESLMSLNEEDLKRMEKKIERESKRMETHKKKLIKSNSDSGTIQKEKKMLQEEDAKAELSIIESDENKNELRRTKAISSTTMEPINRNFGTRGHPAWCRVDCFERQHHLASFKMGRPAIVIDGAETACEASRISFGKMPSYSNDSKVLKIRSCIGKGLQLHQDDEYNLWATRHGKNPIFARGYTLCPELIKLDGKLTQGVPMKVFDVARFESIVKDECDNFDDGDENALKEKLYATSKVCMSFIKDTVVDEDTPCWIEIWMLKHLEIVKNCIRDQKLRRHVQDRLETTPISAPPPIEHIEIIAEPTPECFHEVQISTTPTPPRQVSPETSKRSNPFKSHKKQSVTDESPNPITEKITPPSSIESSPPLALRSQPCDSREGMSYRQVFGIQKNDYFFDIEPPTYSKQRRYSDSDSESLRNFLQTVLPRQTSHEVKEKSSPFQPKKWIRRARKKSEDRKKNAPLKL